MPTQLERALLAALSGFLIYLVVAAVCEVPLGVANVAPAAVIALGLLGVSLWRLGRVPQPIAEATATAMLLERELVLLKSQLKETQERSKRLGAALDEQRALRVAAEQKAQTPAGPSRVEEELRQAVRETLQEKQHWQELYFDATSRFGAGQNLLLQERAVLVRQLVKAKLKPQVSKALERIVRECAAHVHGSPEEAEMMYPPPALSERSADIRRAVKEEHTAQLQALEAERTPAA